MKAKALKYPNGSVAMTTGLQVKINGKDPIIEEEFDIDDKNIKKFINPGEFKFSNKSKKIKTDKPRKSRK